MKKKLLAIIFFLAGNTAFSQSISYTNCTNCWNPDSLGNHRFLINFNGPGKYAKVLITWRRRDENPQDKRIIVEDAKTGERVLNVKAANINREFGEIYFEPLSGNGNYYVYYMPYKNEGRSNYPRGVYLRPDTTADNGWLSKINAAQNDEGNYDLEYQSIDSFNSFYPMEFIPTAEEKKSFITKNTVHGFIVVPESRM